MHWRWLASAAMVGLTGLATLPAATAQTLRAVMHSDIKVLDPVWSGAYIVRNHGYMIYDVLFALDAKLQPQPQMVERWKVSEDGLTYTFILRDGLEWHDGQPVTAEDCIASLKRWGARDPMGTKLMPFVSELKALDTRTFALVLKEPYGLVIESLAKPSVVVPFIMPKRIAETDPFQQFSEYVGSGPFVLKLDEWKPGERIVYLKNRKYKPRAEPPSGMAGGKLVKLDRVEWIAMPDAQTQVNALLNGEIDMLESPAFDLLPLIEKDKTIQIVKSSFGNQYIFRPNWLQPPFNNEKIRQAAQMALNQEDFLKTLIGDPRFYRTCKALFPCGTTYASEVGMAGLVEGNAQKARAMLQEAGYDGTPVTLLHSTDLAVLANLAPVAKNLLEKAGFKVDMQSMDWQSLVNRVISKKGPPSEGGWNAFLTSWTQVDILNPLSTPSLQSSCDKARAGWPCDETMETLRLDFARAVDPAKRKAIADDVQLRYLKIVTHVHLGEWFGVAAYSRKVDLGDWPASPPVTAFWNVSIKK